VSDWHPDPAKHHPFCQFYREGSDCTCAEGKEAADLWLSCGGTKCKCHEPSICSDCGCLHNEGTA
jgi:hypothetical protein